MRTRLFLLLAALVFVAGCGGETSSVSIVDSAPLVDGGADGDAGADSDADSASVDDADGCAALSAYLIDPEMSTPEGDPTLEKAKAVLAGVSPELGELGAAFDIVAEDLTAALEVDRQLREIDELTVAECGYPFVSASIAVGFAIDVEVDAELTFPTSLPCFETTDVAAGDTGFDYVPVVCGTTAPARWDSVLGDWAATDRPVSSSDMTEEFEVIVDSI